MKWKKKKHTQTQMAWQKPMEIVDSLSIMDIL